MDLAPTDLTRLALAHPRDLDRWAGAVGKALALPRGQQRALARWVALEGDSGLTRACALTMLTSGLVPAVTLEARVRTVEEIAV